MITLAAILFGGIAVTFGVGLGASLDRVYNDLSHAPAGAGELPGGPASGSVVKGAGPGPAVPSPAAQERAVEAALRGQPGTLHYAAEADDDINALGLPDRLSLTGFTGDASWTGYAMITGHWYSGTGEADVNTAFLTDTGTKVGDTYTLTSGTRHLTVRIVGEVFDPRGGHPGIIASTFTLAALDPGLAPGQYDVALKPGTNAQAYAHTVGTALGHRLRRLDQRQQLPAVLHHHRPDHYADAAARRGRRPRRAQHRRAADQRARARPRRVQGGRHDAPADGRHGGVLGRRDRPGRRPGRDPGRHRAAPLRATGHGSRRADRGAGLGARTCTAPGNWSCSRWPA